METWPETSCQSCHRSSQEFRWARLPSLETESWDGSCVVVGGQLVRQVGLWGDRWDIGETGGALVRQVGHW